MSMTDPIADFLTHLRNALMRKHATVDSPSSKLKAEIARVLKEEGYIMDFLTYADEQGHARIEVTLKYDPQGDSVIRGLHRISRPGLRRHKGYDSLHPVWSGQGIAILTTSKGVLTDLACRERKVGGEVLCEVW
jgi:small subunit ribosomal protein S8